MKIKNRYLIIIISALIVSGCQKPDFSEEERYIVKVLFLTADSFMEYAGEAFMAKHSNVLIDVIPFPLYVNIDRFEEELDRVIEETNPDILYIGSIPERVRRKIEQGVLMDLSPLLAKDKEFMNKYHSGIMRATRAISGEDGIFGLGDTFDRIALYYHSPLFQQVQAIPPDRDLDWRRMLELASQFKHVRTPDGKQIAGLVLLQYNDIFSVIADYAATEQLNLIDLNTGISFSSEPWASIVHELMTGLREGYIKMPYAIMSHKDEGFDTQELHAAMVLGSMYWGSQLDETIWGVSPEPIGAVNQDLAYHLSWNMFGINPNTDVLPAAWELLKFIVQQRTVVLQDRGEILYTYQDNRSSTDERFHPLYHFNDILLPLLPNFSHNSSRWRNNIFKKRCEGI